MFKFHPCTEFSSENRPHRLTHVEYSCIYIFQGSHHCFRTQCILSATRQTGRVDSSIHVQLVTAVCCQARDNRFHFCKRPAAFLTSSVTVRKLEQWRRGVYGSYAIIVCSVRNTCVRRRSSILFRSRECYHLCL